MSEPTLKDPRDRMVFYVLVLWLVLAAAVAIRLTMS
jgi:hypothetical protein